MNSTQFVTNSSEIVTGSGQPAQETNLIACTSETSVWTPSSHSLKALNT